MLVPADQDDQPEQIRLAGQGAGTGRLRAPRFVPGRAHRIERHVRSLEVVLDQAQEGRRRREARQALHEARPRDHRRRAGRRRQHGRQPGPRPRRPEGPRRLDAQGQHPAGDRPGDRRRRRCGRDRERHVRGLRPGRRGDHGRGADRQPQPDRGGDPACLRAARRKPRRAGLGRLAVREPRRDPGGRRPLQRGRPDAGHRCGRGGRDRGRRPDQGHHRCQPISPPFARLSRTPG